MRAAKRHDRDGGVGWEPLAGEGTIPGPWAVGSAPSARAMVHHSAPTPRKQTVLFAESASSFLRTKAAR